MVQLLWRNDCTLYQTFHTQTGFHVLAHISHIDFSVTHLKLEILASVRVQTHDLHIFNCLFFLHFLMQADGLLPPPYRASRVHSIISLTIGCVSSSGF